MAGRESPGSDAPAPNGRARRVRGGEQASSRALLFATAPAGDGGPAAGLEWEQTTLLGRLLEQVAELGVREAHLIHDVDLAHDPGLQASGHPEEVLHDGLAGQHGHGGVQRGPRHPGLGCEDLDQPLLAAGAAARVDLGPAAGRQEHRLGVPRRLQCLEKRGQVLAANGQLLEETG